MTISSGFLIYVTIFRLTVLAIGALAVYLGFRLFTKNSIEKNVKDSVASASAEGGGFKVTLTNFWPGAYFALFGTVIIGIMLWKGTPELIMKELKDVTDGGKVTGKVRSTELQMRTSVSDSDIDQQWAKLSEPGLTLSDSAQALSNIARIWQQQARTGEALAMIRLAVKKDQDNAAYMALYAELLMDNGNAEDALKVMQAAAVRDEDYRKDLTELRKRLGKSDN